MRIAALYMPLLSIVLENKERFRPIIEPTNPDAALGTSGNAEGELVSAVGSSSGRPPSTLFDAISVASQRTMVVNSGGSALPTSVSELCPISYFILYILWYSGKYSCSTSTL